MELKQAFEELNIDSWASDPEFDVVRLNIYGYEYIGSGSDRDVYQTPIEGILLKTAIGPQISEIPEKWNHLYLPYYEFELPLPVRSGTDEEIRKHITRTHTWGQLQLRCELPEINNIYLEDTELDHFVFSSCMNKEFIQALIDYYKYSNDEIKEFINASLEAGLGVVSSRNWGYLNEAPIIFDTGVIQWLG